MNWMRHLQQQRGQTTTSGLASVEPSPTPRNDTSFTKSSTAQWEHTAADNDVTSSVHNPGQIALGLTSLGGPSEPHCLPIPSRVHIGNDHHTGLDNSQHFLFCSGSQICTTTEPSTSSSPLMQHRPVTESYQPSMSKSENEAATRRGDESRQTVVDSRDLSKNNQITVVPESSDPSTNDDALDVMMRHGIVGGEVIPPTASHRETDDRLPADRYREAEPSACYETLKARQTSAVGGGQFVRSVPFVFGSDGENRCHPQSTTSLVSEMQSAKDQLPMQAFRMHSSITHLVYKENGGAMNTRRCSSPNVHSVSDGAVYRVSRSSTVPYGSTLHLPDYQMTIDRSKSSGDLIHVPASLELRNVSQDIVSKWNEPLPSTSVSWSSAGDSVCRRSVGPECPCMVKVGEYSDGAMQSSTMVPSAPDQPMAVETDSSRSDICQVCSDTAAGFHCGTYVCEACKV